MLRAYFQMLYGARIHGVENTASDYAFRKLWARELRNQIQALTPTDKLAQKAR